MHLNGAPTIRRFEEKIIDSILIRAGRYEQQFIFLYFLGDLWYTVYIAFINHYFGYLV